MMAGRRYEGLPAIGNAGLSPRGADRKIRQRKLGGDGDSSLGKGKWLESLPRKASVRNLVGARTKTNTGRRGE